MTKSCRIICTQGFCGFGIMALVTLLSSCALDPSYFAGSGVEIELISTQRARIESAGFLLDDETPRLHGVVRSIPGSRRPLRGHLDIEIVEPNQGNTTCLTARALFGARMYRKRFSLPLDTLPAPGSTVRVWHDPSSEHTTCNSSRPPTTQEGGSSV